MRDAFVDAVQEISTSRGEAHMDPLEDQTGENDAERPGHHD